MVPNCPKTSHKVFNIELKVVISDAIFSRKEQNRSGHLVSEEDIKIPTVKICISFHPDKTQINN